MHEAVKEVLTQSLAETEARIRHLQARTSALSQDLDGVYAELLIMTRKETGLRDALGLKPEVSQ